jgi:hypothetical protein
MKASALGGIGNGDLKLTSLQRHGYSKSLHKKREKCGREREGERERRRREIRDRLNPELLWNVPIIQNNFTVITMPYILVLARQSWPARRT